MHISSSVYRLLAITLMAILSGCAAQTTPEITSYTIALTTHPDVPEGKKPFFNKILKVTLPKSSSAIMSRDILYQGKDYALNAYAYSSWSETPNRMLGNLFISSIRNSNAFRVVLPVDSRGKGDYILESTIYEFHQNINDANSADARIRIMFYLIKIKSGDVVSSKELAASVPTVSVDVKGGVGALNKASNSISARLNEWLLSLDLD